MTVEGYVAAFESKLPAGGNDLSIRGVCCDRCPVVIRPHVICHRKAPINPLTANALLCDEATVVNQSSIDARSRQSQLCGHQAHSMFRILLSSIALLLACHLRGQGVGINNPAPHTSALLDLTSTGKGLLMPRMTTVQRDAIATPAASLLIYNTTNTRFEFFDGLAWVPLVSTGWSLTGNAGTNPAIHFIGTTDNNSLRLRVNNENAGFIDMASRTVALGRFAGHQTVAGTGGVNSVAIGDSAGFRQTFSVQGNTMVGARAGLNNQFGYFNTFLGLRAGYLSTGLRNTLLGMDAGRWVTSGSDNAFVGAEAGRDLSQGSGNSALGAQSRFGSGTIANSTAIGNRAQVDQSNSIVLGSIAGVNTATNTVNVGIGTTTPSDRLHVVGSIRMVDGNQAAGRVMVSNANGTGSWQTLPPASSTAWGLAGNTGTNPTTQFIGTTDNQGFALRTNNSERVRITASGDVGIGIAAPTQRLHVAGRSLFHDGFSADNAALLYRSNTDYMFLGPQSGSSANGAAIALFGSTNASGGNANGMDVNVPNGRVRFNQTNAQFEFRSNSTSGYTASMELNDVGLQIGHNSVSRNIQIVNGGGERMRIDAAGRVGINTIAPATSLHVNGGIATTPAVATAISAPFNYDAGNRSYVRMGSDLTPGWRLIVLANGLTPGQILVVECTATGGNGITFSDGPNMAVGGGFSGRIMFLEDTITLIWSGTKWVEISFTDN
jgi:hypothetical protein